MSLSGFESRGRHAPKQGSEGAALGYDTRPHHQLGAPSVAFLEADDSVDQDTDGAQAACGKNGSCEARLPPHSQTRVAPPRGTAGPGLRDRPSPAAIAPARAPHPASVLPPPAPPSPRGTRGFSRVLRRNLSANPSSGNVGNGLGSSGGGGPAAMAKVTARPFPAAVAPPPEHCMPGVAVRRAHLPHGSVVLELHFPWCLAAHAAAPWPARNCPPCRRPRGRAGGTNTPTTSTASGSTAAPAAAPHPASPGERRRHGGPAWAGAGRPGAAARVCGEGDAHRHGVGDTAVMSLVPAQLAHPPCMGPAQVGGAEPGRDGPGRGSQQGCPHPEEAAEMELEASLPEKKSNTLSRDLIDYVKYMIQNHGENYKEMARDEKNYYQDTPKQIKRKINVYKNFYPEEYKNFIASLKPEKMEVQ
uniref:Nucleolar protein 16 n=1 Tax=Serinus canaria TaxID=9135 RepID=A0A8C9NJ57_SERCA